MTLASSLWTNSANFSPFSKSDLRAAVRQEIQRRSLIDFAQAVTPWYEAEAFHTLIAGELDKVVQGETKRLMIFAPPQFGKSLLTSVLLPAYWLGRRPDDPVILASYGAELAQSKSRYAREIISEPSYQGLFPGIALRRDSRAVDRWELAPPNRGSMLAVGVGGPVRGHGARLGVIDDPFKSIEEFYSQVFRDRVWNWYRSNFRTRIWPGGAIVLIMTRGHEDDLAGRLLNEQGGEWTVLRLPALAETQEERDGNNKLLGLSIGQPDPLRRKPGESLSPKRFPAPDLEAIKREVGSVYWSSDYQGVPRAREGNWFKREWFEIVHALPAAALQGRMIRYWDKAASTSPGAAFTAGVLMAYADGIFYVVHVVRGQWSTAAREAIIKQTAALDRSLYGKKVRTVVEQEPGSGGMDSATNTITNLVGYSAKADRPTGDKDLRLEPFAAQAEVRNIKLLFGPWNAAYLEELLAVPNGARRDQADASAGGFNLLALHKPKRLITRGA